MVPAVSTSSTPWLRAPADLPADIRPATRWGLIVGVVITHIVVATVVVITSRQDAVVAEPAPIAVALLTETTTGQLVPAAPPVVRPVLPSPVPVNREVVPTPAPLTPTPPVVAVAAPVQAQEMVVPVTPAVVDTKPVTDTPPVAAPAATNTNASPNAADGAAQSASVTPIQLTHTSVRYLKKVEPIYPKASIRLDESGHVVIAVVVDDHGMPVSATVKQSSGFTRLDNAARDAAMQSRYVPYTLNGVPKRFETQAPYTFKPSVE